MSCVCVGAIIAVQAAGATISSAAEEGLTGTAIQQPAAVAGGMRTPAAVRVPVANPRMKFSFGNMPPLGLGMVPTFEWGDTLG